LKLGFYVVMLAGDLYIVQEGNLKLTFINKQG